jgi:hypothetical protein
MIPDWGPTRKGCGPQGLGTGKTQDPPHCLAIAAAPVGDRTVTVGATRHGHTHERQHGGQGMPPASWIAGSRDFMSAKDEGTDWGFH